MKANKSELRRKDDSTLNFCWNEISHLSVFRKSKGTQVMKCFDKYHVFEGMKSSANGKEICTFLTDMIE